MRRIFALHMKAGDVVTVAEHGTVLVVLRARGKCDCASCKAHPRDAPWSFAMLFPLGKVYDTTYQSDDEFILVG